jgi:hypothetical protein
MLTEREQELLETICANPHCYRETAPGYVVCLNCLHGTSPQADPCAVRLKKRLERNGVLPDDGDHVDTRKAIHAAKQPRAAS